ncbi:hypothetical protein KIN20_016981 [Parelaphostrongylus tenuis]|uniref:Uncharacterized protein n=1 Tax=Parelaphostrongylus tenuis TaxID=148309 RepID=A0AAD5N0B7_PARTN|nr:hypothetical protein KIN20_016981 [Parelaphostrongylus tenuis]
METPCSAVSASLVNDRGLGRITQRSLRTIVCDNRLDSFRILHEYPLDSAVSCMDIDRETNAFLLCGAVSGRIYLSNLYHSEYYGPNQKEKSILPGTFYHTHFVSGCQWYHDIRLFVTASTSGELLAWDLTSLRVLESYEICESGKWSPQLHWNEIDKTNPLIAVTNGTNRIPLYDLRVGDMAQTLRSKEAAIIRAVRWLPSKHHILFSGNDTGVVARWDVRSNREALSSIDLKKGVGIAGMRLTSGGKHLVVVFANSAVVLFDAVTMDVLAEYKPPLPRRLRTTLCPLGHFAICDEGTAIRVALPLKDDIDWIRFSKGFRQEPRVSICSTLSGHLSHVNACVYRVGSQQGVVMLLQLQFAIVSDVLALWGEISTPNAARLRLTVFVT